MKVDQPMSKEEELKEWAIAAKSVLVDTLDELDEYLPVVQDLLERFPKWLVA